MSLKLARRRTQRWLVVCAALLLAFRPHAAHAWAIGSQINEDGCHEPITAAALRAVRAAFGTAPVLTPTRDEAALIADVVFAPPKDFVHDLAGMTLLLGVRDNDLKGQNPLSSLDLIQVHGSPTTQDEHCIRAPGDDDAAGNQAALAACQAFIIKTATEALDGLDASGKVDPTRRAPFTVHLGIRGQVSPPLPVFYTRVGAAMHALEDGFPHTYRTSDGMRVTVVLNWIDLVNGSYDEVRDGPPHRAELDRCWDGNPIIRRNYDLATQAATDLLRVALDPNLTREQKIRQFDVVTTNYLSFQPGCTFDNHWCDSPEATVTNSIGCNAAGPGPDALWGALAVIGIIVVCRRRRDRLVPIGLALALAAGVSAPARADAPKPAPPPPSSLEDATPAVPIPPTDPTPANGQKPGQEPGRDLKTPSVTEVAAVRADKQLGSPWGFTASFGGAIDRPALVTSIGGRYRITEEWVVGLDAGWNPWLTTSPMQMHTGVATVAATLIRRFPMRFDRVNLRTSLHLGTSTLLFDVYGAPKYSTGPYAALSPLGLDYDLGGSVRIVWDPMEIAVPVPLLGQLPLYYEQFRMVIGIQIGS